MKKIIFFLFITVLAMTCKSPAELISIEGHTFKEFMAPGVLKISSNFYADEKELSNTSYKEFMFWMKRVFGEHSLEYMKTVPDMMPWDDQNDFVCSPLRYFEDPSYDAHPVVGISLEQAKVYTNWRTERVAEMLLIREKLIHLNCEPSRDNYFTIGKYLAGNYEGTIKLKSELVLPKYTIPTIEEWEMIAGINSNSKFGLDSLDKHNRTLVKDNVYLFNTKELFIQQLNNVATDSIKFLPTTITNNGYKNIYGLKNVVGNVSELVNTPGITKGGAWCHFLENIDLKQNKPTDIPNSWTGFRNVCKFEIRRAN